MKELAQKILIDIIAFTIQLVIQETIRDFFRQRRLERKRKT